MRCGITIFVTSFVAIIPANADDVAPEFRRDVLPILTRAGCNAGACHGAAAGRGGLQLSLYGSRPEADRDEIALELRGRRINQAVPAESLFYLKPTESVEHGGGFVLDPSEREAQTLLRWLETGAAIDPDEQLTAFSVAPVSVRLRPGESVIPEAWAAFSRAGPRDVTADTKLTTTDKDAITIDQMTHAVTAVRPGRHFVMVRFCDELRTIEILVPFDSEFAPVSRANPAGPASIDELIAQRREQLNLPFAGPASDAGLLRRLRLDLTGRLPEPEEILAWLGDSSTDKRAKKIDELLNSREFVDFWTYRYATWLRLRPVGNDLSAPGAFHAWIRQQIVEDVPLTETVAALLTAEGDSHEIGPATFIRLAAGAREQAEQVSEILMGVRLKCANCHDHPLDQWTQDDYHGLAAVFARRTRGQVVGQQNTGDVIHPVTMEAAVPRVPGVRNLSYDHDPAAEFSDWLTAADNQMVARNFVNRVWAWTMGRGLVEPVDDFRVTNPPTHPELLEWLVADFVAHRHSLRHTLRTICLSDTYAMDSTPPAVGAANAALYTHRSAHPLEAEVLMDAICDATGVPFTAGSTQRSIALIDPGTESRALDLLGRCSREEGCEADTGATAGGLSRELHLINGPLLNERLNHSQGRLQRLLRNDHAADDIISEFYLRTLSRPPTKTELGHWQHQVASAPSQERSGVIQDIVWSLLSCRQFQEND